MEITSPYNKPIYELGIHTSPRYKEKVTRTPFLSDSPHYVFGYDTDVSARRARNSMRETAEKGSAVALLRVGMMRLVL